MNLTNLKWKLNVSYSLDKGGRNYMEDVMCSHFERDNENVIFGLFGIFDGHGGVEAANFVKNTLKNELIKIDKFWSNDNDDVLESIKLVYSKIQKLIWIDRENWPRTISGYKSTAGTTATIVIIRNGTLYTGHVGDSGILLVYLNENKVLQSEELTKEHKPEDPEEKKRIEDSGGSLRYNGGVVRVNWHRGNTYDEVREKNKIPFLAVARSLGDLWSYDTNTHRYHVSPEPDVACVLLDFGIHRAIVIGSDGLWNVISQEICVKLLNLCNFLNKNKYVLNPAQLIINYCLFQWEKKNLKADNVSAIVILLQPEISTGNFMSSLEFQDMGAELLDLFNELRTNNLFTNCPSEECEILLDNFPDASRYDRYSIRGQDTEDENLSLLKEYMKTNKSLSLCCQTWYHIENYWPILLKAFENLGVTNFPNIILYLDSCSDVYLEELLIGFPWSICCLELLDLMVLSSKIRNYIKLQPLLTEFWVSFYKVIINNHVIFANNQLSSLSTINTMRNILFSKSGDLSDWITSLISAENRVSITHDDSAKLSMKKSITINSYTSIKDFFAKQNYFFRKNSTRKFSSYFQLKRSASYDISESQLYSNYQTSFGPFKSPNTPLLSPNSSQSNCSIITTNTDFISQISNPKNHNLPYSLKRQMPINNRADLIFLPDTEISDNQTSNIINHYSYSKKRRFIS